VCSSDLPKTPKPLMISHVKVITDTAWKRIWAIELQHSQ